MTPVSKIDVGGHKEGHLYWWTKTGKSKIVKITVYQIFTLRVTSRHGKMQ